ncbi:hypothetical protein PV646_28425 [Streptomyces sp. ID05-26A]|nr:hypothetical protein [Streptomyces sp. ID05-26A]
MTTAERTRLAVVREERLVRIVQVAFSLEQLETVTGESANALRRRIHNAALRARTTGHRYLVTGPAAVAAGLRNAHTLIDYQQVIDAKVDYTLRELADFLSLSYFAARRLIEADRINPVGGPTARVHVRGAEILRYLDGNDEPMQHPESA